MSDKSLVVGDDMIEAQLKEKSARLNISLEELIDRYIRRGLFMDDHYKPPKLTYEELIEISKKNVEEDMKRGIPPKKHNFDVFVGRLNESGIEGDIMDFHYEIKNEKLRKMVEKKAEELGMTTDRLIWGYINRGLMEDNFSEEVFREVHSEEFLKEVNEALGLD